MRISICIPQYNRIEYLLKSLSLIEHQTYADIEVAISDDGSTDRTVQEITQLRNRFKYPIVFHQNDRNRGYDYNYRKCIEIATGDYAIVIGNDDSIVGNDSIALLADFLIKYDYPDIGFCNMVEDRTGGTLIRRAIKTAVLGAGPEVALKNYSCFSFVGGLVYKRSTFLRYNTDRYDGSVFSQMYLGVFMISKGAVLFSIQEHLVLKDILLNGVFRHSYRDRIAKRWKDFRIVDGGVPSVINVLLSALRDAQVLTSGRAYKVFARMYLITCPHWIMDYRANNALPEAVGFFRGVNPLNNSHFKLLTFPAKVAIIFFYISTSIVALIFPTFVFNRIKNALYGWFKK